MLKKAIGPPLPCGRGSVSAYKLVNTFLSRARKQAIFRLLQHSASDAGRSESHHGGGTRTLGVSGPSPHHRTAASVPGSLPTCSLNAQDQVPPRQSNVPTRPHLPAGTSNPHPTIREFRRPPTRGTVCARPKSCEVDCASAGLIDGVTLVDTVVCASVLSPS